MIRAPAPDTSARSALTGGDSFAAAMTDASARRLLERLWSLSRGFESRSSLGTSVAITSTTELGVLLAVRVIGLPPIAAD
jgi:hypothetical protein